MAFDIRLCPNSANNPPCLSLVDADMVSMLNMNPLGLFELPRLRVHTNQQLAQLSERKSSPLAQHDCTNLCDPTQALCPSWAVLPPAEES